MPDSGPELAPVACPRCQSQQVFKPKLRDTEHGWQELYVHCKMCRWEKVLTKTTHNIEQLKRRLLKAEAAITRREANEQDPPRFLRVYAETLRKEISRKIEALKEKSVDC